MRKAFKGMAIAAAMLWAGSAQAAYVIRIAGQYEFSYATGPQAADTIAVLGTDPVAVDISLSLDNGYQGSENFAEYRGEILAFTINGQSALPTYRRDLDASVDNDLFKTAARSTAYSQQAAITFVLQTSGTSSALTAPFLPTFADPSLLDTALFSTTLNDFVTGGFGLAVYTRTGPAIFEISGLPVSPAPVPESATWAMMLIGFGAIGSALRRRATAILAPALPVCP